MAKLTVQEKDEITRILDKWESKTLEKAKKELFESVYKKSE